MAVYPMVPFWSLLSFINDSDIELTSGVRLEDIESWSGNLIADKEPPESYSGTPYQNGDILFGKLRPYLAKSWLATGSGAAVGDIHVYRPNPGQTEPRFLAYIVRTPQFISYAEGSSEGVKMPRCEWSKLRQFPTPFPDLDTQRRIADYLDAETAQIDALVAELDEYVELLAKRKDQLVENRLKELSPPTCAVGFVGDVLLGKMVNSSSSPDADELRPYLRAAHVQPQGVMDLSVPEKMMWFSPSEVERLDLKAGDVVVVEGGAGFGRASCLAEDMDGWGFQNSINRIRVFPERARGEYVSLMINRALVRGEIAIAANVATIPHFTAEKLARFRIPLLSIEQQDTFLNEVLDELARTDTIITQCRELKELLLKRRQVLITDVVTGKVEV